MLLQNGRTGHADWDLRSHALFLQLTNVYRYRAQSPAGYRGGRLPLNSCVALQTSVAQSGLLFVSGA